MIQLIKCNICRELWTTDRASSVDLVSGRCPICTRGRKVVVMDLEMYTQLLTDLALLREQLSQLSEVIQVS